MCERRGSWHKLVFLAVSLVLMLPLLSACNILDVNSPSGPTTADGTAVTATSETEIFNNGNSSGVINNPTGGPTTFTINDSYKVTLIIDYHWNNGQGASAGTIGLKDANGKVIGTWPVTVRSGVYWDVIPNVVIGPGTYTVVDSDLSTWAQNNQSKNQGITDVKGLAITYVTNSQSQTPTSKTSDSSTSSIPTPSSTPMDVVVDKTSAPLNQKGGELDLKNGAKLLVPVGALNADSTLQVRQLNNPLGFGKDAVAYQFTSTGTVTGVLTLTFPVPQGMKNQDLSVCGFNPGTFQTSNVPYTFNPQGNTVTATIDPQKLAAENIKSGQGTIYTGLLSMLNPMFYLPKGDHQDVKGFNVYNIVYRFEPYHMANHPEHVIQTPYYMQSGGSCWAADTMMLLRYYDTGDVIQRNLGEALYTCNSDRLPPSVLNAIQAIPLNGYITNTEQYRGASLNDFGISPQYFEDNLARYISGETGATVQWRGFTRDVDLHSEILNQLDQDHPVIIDLSGMGHWILIVGYRDSGQTLVIQDPKGMPFGSRDGGMYSIRDYSWISNNIDIGRSQPVPMLWVDKQVNRDCPLQTIGCPGGADRYRGEGQPLGGLAEGTSSYGSINFYAVNPKVKPPDDKISYAWLQFDPSKVVGYSWYNIKGEANPISSRATNLELNMPVWNAALSSVNATEKTTFLTETTKLDEETQGVNLPAAKDNTTVSIPVKQDIPLSKLVHPELANKDGNQPLMINVTLNVNGRRVDYFSLDASLSIMPIISSLTPNSVAAGAPVAIIGSDFGSQKLAKSRVTVNDKDAEIVKWLPGEIDIKVPADAGSGQQPVIVYTGDNYEFKSDPALLNVGALTGTLADSIYGSYEMTASWQVTPAGAQDLFGTGLNIAGSELNKGLKRVETIKVAAGIPVHLVVNVGSQKLTTSTNSYQIRGVSVDTNPKIPATVTQSGPGSGVVICDFTVTNPPSSYEQVKVDLHFGVPMTIDPHTREPLPPNSIVDVPCEVEMDFVLNAP